MTDNRTSSKRVLMKVATMLPVIGLTALGWLQLAPPSLGGHTSYAVITGNSMEPMLHGGDLALIRRSDSYAEGDVAAFNSKDLNNLVLHRIIGSSDGRFTTKGDNNDFTDPEQPTHDQFVGRLWVRIPKAGGYMARLRDPRIAALPAALVALIAFASFSRGTRRRRGSTPQHRAQPHVVPSGGRSRKPLFVCAAGIMCVSVGAAAIGFSRSAASSSSSSLGYEETGVFSYAAGVNQGSVYDAPTVRTGEPVYLRMAKDLTVDFDYGFETSSPARVTGEASMVTTLAASNGWSRTVARTAPVPIADGVVHLQQKLEVDSLQKLVESIQEETGVSETYYTLAFSAEVASEAQIAGRMIEESMNARMPFQLDSFQLRLDTGAEDGEATDPTTTIEKGSVSIEQTSVGRVQVGPLGVDVPVLRSGAMVGVALALLLAGVAMYRGRSSDLDGIQRIADRNSDVIVRARSIDHPGWGSALEVHDFEGLRKISDAYETMILHAANDEAVFFTIHENQIYFVRIESLIDDIETPRLATLPLRNSVTFIEDLMPSTIGARE